MIRVLTARPDPALRPFIHLFVQRDGDIGSGEIIEPVVARLGAKLEFKFADRYKIRSYSNNATLPSLPFALLGPQTFRRVWLSLTSRVESVAVTFQPCGFHLLFGVPMNHVVDIAREGHALLGKDVSHLYEELGNLTKFAERTERLNAYFLKKLGSVTGDLSVPSALQALVFRRDLTISDAVQQTGLSRRQFERKSVACAGMPPKDLSRIARFSVALRMSRTNSLSWTEIAHASGYYDQAHMVKDFHTFAGQAPSLTLRDNSSTHFVNFSAMGDVKQERFGVPKPRVLPPWLGRL
jgi:AraC-like DNA-binding protein